jgi:tRNA threonylcarbamoyladenosine biosynthesis protein TsaE
MRDPGSPALSLDSGAPDETRAVAAALAKAARAGDWIALDGELGAGKTLFTAAFCEALGVPPGEVDSPSFVLLNEYAGRLPLFHFDAYRLRGEQAELSEIGFFDERLAAGIVLVEWAERVAAYLPPEALHVRLAITGPDSRRIEIAEPGPRVRAALAPPAPAMG